MYVNTGEVRSAGAGTILNSGAIGSCVVVAAFDPVKTMGAMVHVMLPGRCPSDNQPDANQYAANAIEEMMRQLGKYEVQRNTVALCLVGGANVLRRADDNIAKDNLDSVEMLLGQKQLGIRARATGGFERRTVCFDIGRGCMHYTVGDSVPRILWQTGLQE